LQRYHLLLEKKALKQLNRLDPHLRNRILSSLYTLRDEGFSRKLDIVKLKGFKNQYRLRVGKHMVFVDMTSFGQ
jgi:mRNA-degrading endonuclease RelE of RelBE toxin-antitoxin system